MEKEGLAIHEILGSELEGLTKEEQNMAQNIYKRLGIQNFEEDLDKINLITLKTKLKDKREFNLVKKILGNKSVSRKQGGRYVDEFIEGINNILSNIESSPLTRRRKPISGKKSEIPVTTRDVEVPATTKPLEELTTKVAPSTHEEEIKPEKIKPEEVTIAPSTPELNPKIVKELDNKIEAELKESINKGNINEKEAKGIMNFIRKFWNFLTVDMSKIQKEAQEITPDEIKSLLENSRFARALSSLGSLVSSIGKSLEKQGLEPNALQQALIRRGLGATVSAILTSIIIILAVSIIATRKTYKHLYPEKYKEFKRRYKKHSRIH